MCGVLGSAYFTDDVRAALPFVALAMENRGTDAWGASDGGELVRHLGALHATWGSERDRFGSWGRGIFHTRHASQGSPHRLENAHPFRSEHEGRVVIGIHNGCLANHSELNAHYSRRCEVDSEHLWLHRAAGRSWEDIRGYANVAWFQSEPGDQSAGLYICRINNDSLHVVQLADGGILFASTLASLQLGAAMVGSAVVREFPIAEHRVYQLTPEDVVPTGEELHFGSWSGTANSATGTYSSYGAGSHRQFDNFAYREHDSKSKRCRQCRQETRSTEFLFCDKCLLSKMGRWGTRLRAKDRPVPVGVERALASQVGN